mgnify:CR=1 FL=1
MKTLRKFVAYLEDNYNHVDKIALTANSITEAKKYLHGNGEIIKIKDISDEYPISLSQVKKALLDANFGDVEISLILRTLQNTNVADID